MSNLTNFQQHGKRKIIGEKKTRGSCFEGLWSCMRCLMSKKNRYLEKEKEQEPIDFIDLIWEFQSHRIDDQRCSFNTTSKNQVGNAEYTVEVSTPGAEEENASEISSGSASDDTYETAPESSDEGNFVDCADEKLSQRSIRKSSVRSSEGAQSIGSPSLITKQGDYSDLKLEQLEYFATLGKGAYGRVELITLKTDPSRSFALKYVGKNKRWTIMSKKMCAKREDL